MTFILTVTISAMAAGIDTLEIYSTAMSKKLKTVVITPDGYKTSGKTYPVVYLLHGGGGNYKNWLQSVPDKSLVPRMADQHDVIIVTPDGGTTSYYFDSPTTKDSQYETFITNELVRQIDRSYRTIAAKKGRVITGLSMGGHGALFLASRHPDTYLAAGSMSGVMNINTATWKVPEDFAKLRRENFAKLLGPADASDKFYPDYNLTYQIDRIKSSGLALILDCGVDDFLIEPNRTMHQLLVNAGVAHDYIERPGKHDWGYWENALPYHMLFFKKLLTVQNP